MKVKIGQRFKDVDPAKFIKRGESNEELDLKSIIIKALLVPNEKDDSETKYKKYALFAKVQNVWEYDFKAEEIVLLKEVIGKMEPPLIMGQAWDMLEGVLVDDVPKKTEN